MARGPIVERVQSLVRAFLETDLARLRIERDGGHVELQRRAVAQARSPKSDDLQMQPAAGMDNREPVKADLVGIVHLVRPIPVPGEMLQPDRELAYIEALGIRNPVRALHGGKLESIRCVEGEPVEYGQVLFEIERV